MQDLGDVILVKNIIFNNGQVDHASLQGRLCIIVSNIDGIVTLLPFTHRKPKYISETFEFSKSDLINKNGNARFYDRGYINVTALIQRELYFYDKMARLKEIRYYFLVKKLLLSHLEDNEKCGETFSFIKDDLIRQDDYLKKKYKHI